VELGVDGKMKRLLIIGLILGLVWGCAHGRREAVPPTGKRVEVGWASWYGEPFHGRKTASGAVYDMHQLTAAHKTLPLGTRVMVTHLKNGNTVAVTINDRGPFVKGRIIDLSYAAAQALGMAGEGVAQVRVDVIDAGTVVASPMEGLFTVQVGSFADRSNAGKLIGELQRSYQDVYLQVLKTPESTYYRVRLGKFKTREEAYQLAVRLAQAGYTAFMATVQQ
jgi:rare lipoprotein A